MKNKEEVFKAVMLSIIIIFGLITIISISLKSEPRSVEVYEKYNRIGIAEPVRPDDEWVDNFDSSYTDPTTGCLFLTHKKNTKYGRIHQ
jgi:ABC-type maltose transport system permease subunit